MDPSCLLDCLIVTKAAYSTASNKTNICSPFNDYFPKATNPNTSYVNPTMMILLLYGVCVTQRMRKSKMSRLNVRFATDGITANVWEHPRR
jgi:hypothetical protein